ncbi:phosphoribosyl transferase [Chiua virens]|nr:phosphoribosyl transferase [Chiua virens]
MSADGLQTYQSELLIQAEQVGALKFGQFTLKSGRISPYFFNAGLMSSGPILDTIANAYAADDRRCARRRPRARVRRHFWAGYGRAYGFAYDRKEVKDHGEGGKLVGTPVRGKKVLILDDVMTAGTAVRLAIEAIQAAGGEVVGVIQLLDREERGQDGGSTVEEVEHIVAGKGRVLSVLKMRTLMAWLEKSGQSDVLERMKAYWDDYGWKA